MKCGNLIYTTQRPGAFSYEQHALIHFIHSFVGLGSESTEILEL